MRIWFDISNSPHVNMFAGMMRELMATHEVLITCRPLANTIDLLKLHGFEHHVVGQHYGASTFKKAYGFPVRVRQLCRFLANRKPDVAVSQSSFHSPVVARLLGVRSIYMNDNEHALGNVPAFLCATTIMIPEFLDPARVRRQGASLRKIVSYPGVKEGIYLWNLPLANANDPHRISTRGERTVYVRPEPWTAQYYDGAVNFLTPLLLGLMDKVRVVLLPRGAEQARFYRGEEFKGVEVVQGALSLEKIVPDCDLFLGAGGTMTREMAVLGVPTVSVYQSQLLDVDKYLVSLGRLVHRPGADARFVLDFLAGQERQKPSADLLEKGRKAYELILRTILG